MVDSNPTRLLFSDGEETPHQRTRAMRNEAIVIVGGYFSPLPRKPEGKGWDLGCDGVWFKEPRKSFKTAYEERIYRQQRRAPKNCAKLRLWRDCRWLPSSHYGLSKRSPTLLSRLSRYSDIQSDLTSGSLKPWDFS